MEIKPIYLDVCALCRPFDDQSFVRVRMESDAVKLILQNIREGLMQLVLSPVHHREINAINNLVERVELLGIINNLGQQIKCNPKTARQRAEDLIRQGFGIADAAHVAYAEAANAGFITCDDKLLKKCLKTKFAIWYGDPLQFCIKENLK